MTSVADPGSGAFLTNGSRMGLKSRSGSDEHPGSYFGDLRNNFWGSGSFDPGFEIEKNSDTE